MASKKEGGLEEQVGSEEEVYIAHQVRHPFDFDEIMELVLAAQKKENVGVYGPPGVGKTMMIKTLAKILGRDIETVHCAPETGISDIVGGNIPGPAHDEKGNIIPVLTLTKREGPLARAMKQGKIFYADEFNKLTKETQSYLSAPLDFRRELRTIDGETLVNRAANDFMFIASWNPGEEYGGEEILGFIKDRVNYTPFNELNTDLQTRIGLLKAGVLGIDDLKDNKIQTRAIAFLDGGPKFFVKAGKEFINIFDKDDKLPENNKSLKTYLCYVGKEGDTLKTKDKKSQEVYDNLYNVASFLSDIRGLVLNGSEGVKDEISNILSSLSISGMSPLHEVYHIEPRSVRIVESVAKDFDYLLKHNVPGSVITDRIGYKMLNDLVQDKGNVEVAPKITWRKLVEKLGQLYSLKFDDEQYQLVKEEGFAAV